MRTCASEILQIWHKIDIFTFNNVYTIAIVIHKPFNSLSDLAVLLNVHGNTHQILIQNLMKWWDCKNGQRVTDHNLTACTWPLNKTISGRWAMLKLDSVRKNHANHGRSKACFGISLLFLCKRVVSLYVAKGPLWCSIMSHHKYGMDLEIWTHAHFFAPWYFLYTL